MAVEPKALLYKVPGGMLSNLLANLKDMHVEDKYAEVLAEVPRVRADLGYPPLVTPLSQMVGSQALMNVISGERYKVVPAEIKDYVRGQYGRPPVTISEKIRRQIIGDDEVITCRPADLIEPAMPRLREEISQYARSEEDVLSYALFPEQARDFLGRREDPFYDSPCRRSTFPSTWHRGLRTVRPAPGPTSSSRPDILLGRHHERTAPAARNAAGAFCGPRSVRQGRREPEDRRTGSDVSDPANSLMETTLGHVPRRRKPPRRSWPLSSTLRHSGYSPMSESGRIETSAAS